MTKKRLITAIAIFAVIILLILIPNLSGSSLEITNTQIDPIKVKLGKDLTVTTEVKSRGENINVYAEIPYEGGVDKIEMEKIASKLGRDIYQVKWRAHGLANLRWYTGNITATDSEGNFAFFEFDFQDPTVNHTWPQIQGPNGCLISSTLSSCPSGYSVDTRYNGRYIKYIDSYNSGHVSSGFANHTHTAAYGNSAQVDSSGGNYRERGDEENWAVRNDHAHSVTLTKVTTVENNPEYINVLLCCRDA
ncbi:MAG: hypothetical protein KAT43_06595 [Nanoarchaeota archaeon]|nr:hypothetical protein [Nanoarchaeota archaeon]